MINKVYHKGLNENLCTAALSSGAKCYIIPKYGYGEKQAYVAFGYGADDIVFQKEDTITKTCR